MQSYRASRKPLHILVANAGANFPSRRLTEDGVPLPCQVNADAAFALLKTLLQRSLLPLLQAFVILGEYDDLSIGLEGSLRGLANKVPVLHETVTNVQVNYLGHYTLARLLEAELIRSAPSRIISVSSATHRYAAIPDPDEFLSKTEVAQYPDTKLAQVFFTYEAQRRLGPLGVQVRDPSFSL